VTTFHVFEYWGSGVEKRPKSLFGCAAPPGKPGPKPSPGGSLAILASCVPLLDAVVVGQFDSNLPRPVRSRICELGGPGGARASRVVQRWHRRAETRRDPTGARSLPRLGLLFVPTAPYVPAVALPDACLPDGRPLLSGPVGLARRWLTAEPPPPLPPSPPHSSQPCSQACLIRGVSPASAASSAATLSLVAPRR
jgi:hypothetical protein